MPWPRAKFAKNAKDTRRDKDQVQTAEGCEVSVARRERAERDESFVARYFAEVRKALENTRIDPISAAADALYAAWKDGRTVLFCGNGGSGSTCSHIVNDLTKNIGLESGRPMKALSLSDCGTVVSAWANDSAWENVFTPQVACWAEAGDVLVAVSGSGNSANVLNAVAEAKRIGCVVVGLSGFDGGRLRSMVDIDVHVRTQSMQQAEDAHMVILHLLYLLVVERIKGD